MSTIVVDSARPVSRFVPDGRRGRSRTLSYVGCRTETYDVAGRRRHTKVLGSILYSGPSPRQRHKKCANTVCGQLGIHVDPYMAADTVLDLIFACVAQGHGKGRAANPCNPRTVRITT